MGSALVLALVTYTRTCYLAESVDVVGLDAKALFKLLAHLLGPRLGTEHANLKFELAAWILALLHCLAQEHSVAWGTTEDGGSEVVHQSHLLLGVTRRDRDYRCADVGCSVVGTKTSGKEAVAVSHLEDVVLTSAVGGKGARDGLAPHSKVFAGVKYYNWFAGGTR